MFKWKMFLEEFNKLGEEIILIFANSRIIMFNDNSHNHKYPIISIFINKIENVKKNNYIRN